MLPTPLSGRQTEPASSGDRMSSATPDHPLPPQTSARNLIAQGKDCFARADFLEARRCFQAALQDSAATLEARARLAETCAQLMDWSAAAEHWRIVAERRPALAVARTGLAVALRELGRTDDALREFRRAAADNPTMPVVHFNLGTCLLADAQPSLAAAAFREAVRLAPEYHVARWNLSLALLKSGVFKTGALAYEARWQAEWKGKERPFDAPRWTGKPLPENAPLLLWGEQGIGDEIMFAGLVPAAVQLAAAPILLECAPRLVPLFARSFPAVTVVARATPPAAVLATPAVQLPTGSLPGLLWPTEKTPEPAAAYLQADRSAIAQMRERLARLGHGLKIGIAWRGGHPAAGQPRLIPAAAWTGILSRPEVVPISLQHGTTADELAAVSAHGARPLQQIPEADPLTDIDAFAALVAACDAVVSVDNSTVHLAGALGIPTAVLLARDCDWRWGVDGVPCPWYRSVMRLRQKAPGDWSAPLQAAAELLDTLPATR